MYYVKKRLLPCIVTKGSCICMKSHIFHSMLSLWVTPSLPLRRCCVPCVASDRPCILKKSHIFHIKLRVCVRFVGHPLVTAEQVLFTMCKTNCPPPFLVSYAPNQTATHIYLTRCIHTRDTHPALMCRKKKILLHTAHKTAVHLRFFSSIWHDVFTYVTCIPH